MTLQHSKPLKAAVVAWIAFASIAHAHEPVSGLIWTGDPASHCEFVSPVSLTVGPTYWTGACPGTQQEPQVGLDAFRLAAEAAREVAGRYARDGNAASARHYEAVAKRLEDQVE